MQRRLLVFVAMLVVAAASTLGGLATGTTTVAEARSTYDLPAAARAYVKSPTVVGSTLHQLPQPEGCPASPPTSDRCASTTLTHSFVATNSVVGGLDDLAARRAAIGASPAGPGVSPTLSRLDVDGMAPIYGTSGHGQTVTLRVNPISRTHAETDVLQQLSNLGGANGAKATIYIDYPGGLCGACGRSGAVRSMAGQVGISELTVVWPGGSTVIVP